MLAMEREGEERAGVKELQGEGRKRTLRRLRRDRLTTGNVCSPTTISQQRKSISHAITDASFSLPSHPLHNSDAPLHNHEDSSLLSASTMIMPALAKISPALANIPPAPALIPPTPAKIPPTPAKIRQEFCDEKTYVKVKK